MEVPVEVPRKLVVFDSQASRYKCAYGGRGSAKSWSIARLLLRRAAGRPQRVLCAREIQSSIADSCHALLKDQIDRLKLNNFYDVREAAITGANGSEFVFAGLRQNDSHKIKSFEGVDVCWLEEAQAISERSWKMLTPTIRKPGSEIWVSFNPELDTDPTYVRMVSDPEPGKTIAVNINWQDNPWFTAELEGDRLECLRRTPDDYSNIWDGHCRTSVSGAVYPREMEMLVAQGRIRDVPYDPILKVHTVWDLGFNDSMAIAMVQRAGSEIRILDYIEDSGRTLADYVKELETRPYRWGIDFIPHDGRARDYKTGKSSEELLRALGRNVRVLPIDSVEEGIKAVRLMFPRCYFDKGKTTRLVQCLKHYRRGIPIKTGEPGPPIHDQYSHGADDFRYIAEAADKMTNSDERKRVDMTPGRSLHGNAGWMQ